LLQSRIVDWSESMAAAESRRIRLGELLLRAGVITEDQLRSALAEQKKWGGKLGTLLVDLNYLDEEMLVKALSKQLGLPRVDFSGLVVQPQAVKKLEADFADQRQVLPIHLDVAKGNLMVALADPDNLGLVDEIAFRTGCRVKVAIAGEKALATAIRDNYYGDNVPEAVQIDQGEPMKLIDSQGSTMVCEIDDIKAQAQPAAASAPASVPARTNAPATIEQRLGRLEAMQGKEVRVLKTLVELLITKGFITREEYRQKIES
jgi:hypothetical protein